MLQLVYISTARAPVGADSLAQILETSRRNNAKVGITGLLVAGGRRFLQALEGPEAEVLAAYDRIKADPRHYAVVALAMRQTESRSFGDWAMGYENGEDAGDDAPLSETVARLTAPIADRNLRAQFQSFADLHSRAA